jgi:uncharacterized protein YdaU (DUF1376 family)
MSKAPAFQFYVDDFLGGTAHFTASETGGYVRLLCHQWKYGGVPGDNVDRLGAIMGMSRSSAKSAWAVISEKFENGEDALWRNAKLEKVRKGKEKFIQDQADKGARGAAARWGNGRGDGRGHSPGYRESWPGASPEVSPDASPNDGSPNLPSPIRDESKNDSSLRPPGDLLAVHHRLFISKYGAKPSYDGSKDAAIAKRLIQKHGFDGSSQLLEVYFDSRDPWIAKSGHGMGPLGSATTINKLIAEMSGRAPVNDGLDGLREFTRG